jgi:hypothetical protein
MSEQQMQKGRSQLDFRNQVYLHRPPLRCSAPSEAQNTKTKGVGSAPSAGSADAREASLKHATNLYCHTEHPKLASDTSAIRPATVSVADRHTLQTAPAVPNKACHSCL